LEEEYNNLLTVMETMTKTVKMQGKALIQLRKRVDALERQNEMLSNAQAFGHSEVWN